MSSSVLMHLLLLLPFFTLFCMILLFLLSLPSSVQFTINALTQVMIAFVIDSSGAFFKDLLQNLSVKYWKVVLLLLSRTLSDIFKQRLMCNQQSKTKRKLQKILVLEDRTSEGLTFIHKRGSSLIIKIVVGKHGWGFFCNCDSFHKQLVGIHTHSHTRQEVVSLPTISNCSQSHSAAEVYRTEQDFL